MSRMVPTVMVKPSGVHSPVTAPALAGSQTRLGSVIETCAGTAIGYVVAVASQFVILPWFGLPVTLAQDAGMAAIFTVISLVRGYLVRRLFNRLHSKPPLTLRAGHGELHSHGGTYLPSSTE